MSESYEWAIYTGLLFLLLLLFTVADIKNQIKSLMKRIEDVEAEKIELLANIDKNIATNAGMKSLEEARLEEQKDIERVEEAKRTRDLKKRKDDEDDLNRTWNKP